MSQYQFLETAIEDLESLLNVSITIVDSYGLLHDDNGQPYFSKFRQSHQKNSLCKTGFSQKCIDHCRHHITQRCEQKDQFFVHNCWKRIQEVVIPIKINGQLMGSFFIGQWQDENSKKIDESIAKKILAERNLLPTISSFKLEQIGTTVAFFVEGLLKTIEGLKQRDTNISSNLTIINSFFEKKEIPTLKNIATALSLSTSRTSHLIKELTGLSFQENVKRERMNQAKNMLLSTDDSIKEIADTVGMYDAYHFSKVFKIHFGLPHSQFRKAKTEDPN